MIDSGETSRVGHGVNLVGIPTGLLASAAFNDYPLPLSIGGVHELNGALFEMLRLSETPEEAGSAFQNYMRAVFGVNGEVQLPAVGNGARRFRASYLRLLKGWGFDANGPEGAVLKGWVESRFGLLPTFHKGMLGRYPSPAWMTYVEEKMGSRFHNNSINLQLDLLYEFCQWALARFFFTGRHHVTLYRGCNDFDEHPVVEKLGKREAIIRLNNLVSFTSERDVAETFGDRILEASVPLVKILFFNRLLSDHPLKGEAEYLVVGGDYRVKVSYW